ncbi:hypothetical protein MMC07_008571 [Pseudocyphellaria aurata]|nr:hypothetical protein [Pseudocyphellaria aurata]
MVSYDGVTATLLFSKQHFTSSVPYRSSLQRDDHQSDGGEGASGQQQEIDHDDIPSFTSFKGLEGSENLDPKVSRIHVFGGGNLWLLVAHAIAGIPNPPPITLLFRSVKQLRQWQESDRFIEVITDGKGERRYSYDVEFIAPVGRGNIPATPADAFGKDSAVPPEDSLDTNQGADNLVNPSIIHQLVLSSSPRNIVPALHGLTHRLTRNSTILFMQNGLGIVDEVNEKVFPNEATRPSYIIGLVSHLVSKSLTPFSAVHRRMGTMALGSPLRSSVLHTRPPNDSLRYRSQSALYLMRTLTRSLDLAAVCFHPIDLFQMQLERLAIHAVVYPLTVLFDCHSEDLEHNGHTSRVITLLLAEISLIIRSLPELQGVPNVNMRFAPRRLYFLILTMIRSTAGEISPMLWSLRAGRSTDIKYINGYIIQRGEEMGIKCVVNYALMQLVKGKTYMMTRKENESLPVE